MTHKKVWNRAAGLVLGLCGMTCGATAEADQVVVVYAAAAGSGNICSQSAPCTPQAAQLRARALLKTAAQDVIVELARGRYELTQPLQFSADDSGRPGHVVIWRGAGDHGTQLDGGVRIRDWREVDTRKHIWRASLPHGVKSLQLFVDGKRALRARGSGCASPGECRYTEAGIAGVSGRFVGFAHPEELVAVSAVRWRDFHCPVQSIDAKTIHLQQPCWHNTVIDSENGWSQASPKGKYFRQIDWFENAYELLGTPGQFYVDTRESALYYVPRAGEDMRRAEAVMPIADALLDLRGTPAQRIHDLRFEHIVFAHTTWTAADSGEGYVSLQAGYLISGRHDRLPGNGEGMQRIPAAVRVAAGERIVFANDTFHHLGSAGVVLADSTRDSVVTASDFSDISGGAIFVGDTVAHPVGAAERSSGNIVSHNRISRIAQEYRDNVAIMGGFNDGLTIDANTISDIPYSGISVGWGWNYEGEGDTQRDIRITRNRITRFMQALHDGGAIYTQAQSPGSIVAGNYIDFGDNPNGNGIYLDERSRGYRVCANVVWHAQPPSKEMHWLSAWADWSGDLAISGNWSDDPRVELHNPGPTKDFHDNHLALNALTPAAQRIIDASGVDAAKQAALNCPSRAGQLQ